MSHDRGGIRICGYWPMQLRRMDCKMSMDELGKAFEIGSIGVHRRLDFFKRSSKNLRSIDHLRMI